MSHEEHNFQLASDQAPCYVWISSMVLIRFKMEKFKEWGAIYQPKICHGAKNPPKMVDIYEVYDFKKNYRCPNNFGFFNVSWTSIPTWFLRRIIVAKMSTRHIPRFAFMKLVLKYERGRPCPLSWIFLIKQKKRNMTISIVIIWFKNFTFRGWRSM